MLFELHDKSSPFNSTHYIVLYSKNGDTVMTTASVTSPPYVYQWTGETRGKLFLATCAENLGPYVT